jgi:hypothetical protein
LRALDEASSQEDGESRLHTLVGELANRGYASAAACLADDLGALTVHLRYPLEHRRVRCTTSGSVADSFGASSASAG